MSIEVEIKYRIADPAALIGRILGLGATQEATSALRDVYLLHPARDFAETGEAFRIRSGTDRAWVTYKGPRWEGPAKTREEIEIGLADAPGTLEGMTRLLDRLGFRVLAEVVKTRTQFRLAGDGRELLIAVDHADGLGSFAEVEAIAEEEADVPVAQAAVLALAGELGLTEVEPRSYLRMTLERQGR